MNRIRSSWRALFAPLTLALAMLHLNTPLSAQITDGLDGELAKFAERTLVFLKGEEQTSIAVGNISIANGANVPGGPGIRTKLIQALEAKKPGLVSDDATWAINGEMFFLPPPSLDLKIEFRYRNKDTGAKHGEEIIVSTTRISESAFFVGATFQTDPSADLKQQREDVVEGLESGPFRDLQHPSRVRAKADSPFALELRAKPIGAETKAGTPVTATIESRLGVSATQKQTFAIAPIGKNQEYEVVVYNDSENEIAVSITVDGIDVFSFSEDKDPNTNQCKYTHFIIGKNDQLVLPGWHKTVSQERDDNFLAFLVTEYGKGARSTKFPQLALDGSVGAVTVGISKTSKPGDGKKSAQAETGFGRKIKQDQQPVVRDIEPPHAFITIRYDR